MIIAVPDRREDLQLAVHECFAGRIRFTTADDVVDRLHGDLHHRRTSPASWSPCRPADFLAA